MNPTIENIEEKIIEECMQSAERPNIVTVYHQVNTRHDTCDKKGTCMKYYKSINQDEPQYCGNKSHKNLVRIRVTCSDWARAHVEYEGRTYLVYTCKRCNNRKVHEAGGHGMKVDVKHLIPFHESVIGLWKDQKERLNRSIFPVKDKKPESEEKKQQHSTRKRKRGSHKARYSKRQKHA